MEKNTQLIPSMPVVISARIRKILVLITAFQKFYVDWLTTNYTGTKPRISPQAWKVSAGCASPFPLPHMRKLMTVPRAGHTMPQFRIYILDAVIRWHGCFHVLIIPHHCQLDGFQELWLTHNSRLKRSILPLHDICTALGDELTRCLPALHAQTDQQGIN